GRPQTREIVGERQDLPRPADDLGAVGGEFHARAASQEDTRAEQPLDAAQLGTHRRLGVPERRGGPADTPRVGYGAQHTQVAQLKFHAGTSLRANRGPLCATKKWVGNPNGPTPSVDQQAEGPRVMGEPESLVWPGRLFAFDRRASLGPACCSAEATAEA